MPEFDSDGFDLDKLASAADDVVLELNGAVVNENEPDPMEAAETWKEKGNDAFKQKNWEKSYELYSKAIESTPGMSGDEMVALEAAWKEERHRKMREEMRLRRDTSTKKVEDEEDEKQKAESNEPPPKFQPPSHPHGKKLAVYYSNRAASSLQIAQLQMGNTPVQPKSPFASDDDNEANPVNPHLQRAVDDCRIAIWLNPHYVKALVRRSTAYERMGDTENSLVDAKDALALEPRDSAIRTTVSRLQKLEEIRMERLKTETLGKLKELGNSVLSNFGLSLDNFQAVQDPNTGSYSISFNQNNNK